MKLRNLLVIGSLAIPFIAIPLKAETLIKTGSGVRVETNSEGEVNISPPNQNIDSSHGTTIKKKDNYSTNDDYSTHENSSSSEGNCYQENSQSNQVEGSRRIIVQSSTLYCD